MDAERHTEGNESPLGSGTQTLAHSRSYIGRNSEYFRMNVKPGIYIHRC